MTSRRSPSSTHRLPGNDGSWFLKAVGVDDSVTDLSDVDREATNTSELVRELWDADGQRLDVAWSVGKTDAMNRVVIDQLEQRLLSELGSTDHFIKEEDTMLACVEQAGWRTVFLGPAVPIERMLEVARNEKASNRIERPEGAATGTITRSTPLRVLTSSLIAISSGVPRLNCPPMPT